MHPRSAAADTAAHADLAADFAFDPASDFASLRTLLRGFGQIVLQPNACTGACLLAAWLLYEPRLAIAALCGAIAANIGAMLAGHPDDDTRAGLHGFNGALAGLAAFHFIADDAVATAVAILAATGTAWLLRPWSRCLQTRRQIHLQTCPQTQGLAVYSSPCLLTTWLWLAFGLRWVHSAAASTPAAAAITARQAFSTFSVQHFFSSVLASLAQTSFACGALPGLLVLLGIATSSRRHALWALAGASIATAAHLLIGASTASFDAGLSGFNGALTAIALASCRIPVALGGVMLSVALEHAATHFNVPMMTAPFVIATWTMQWCESRFAGRHASGAYASNDNV